MRTPWVDRGGLAREGLAAKSWLDGWLRQDEGACRGMSPRMHNGASRSVELAAADVVKNIDKYPMEGQRVLAFVEPLVKQGVDDAVIAAMKAAARGKVGVDEQEVRRAVLICKAVAQGDEVAKRITQKLRDGVIGSAYTAYKSWRKELVKQGGGVKRAKGPLAGREFLPRARMTKDDMAWVRNTAAEIKRTNSTPGARAIVMNRSLVARGLLSLTKCGGAAAPAKVREKIASELDVNAKELELAMTLLRRHAEGKVAPGSIEAVEKGHFSCHYIVKQCKGKRFIAIPRDRKWLVTEAWRIANAEAHRFTGQTEKTIAFFEFLVAQRAFDPSARISRQAPLMYGVANEVFGTSATEAESCWSLIRAVALGKLPASAMEEARIGASSAGRVIDGAGGLQALIKAHRSKPKAAASLRAEEVADDKGDALMIRVAKSDIMADVDDANGTSASVEDVQAFMAKTASELDEIVSRIDGDEEVLGIARQLRKSLGYFTMNINRLLSKRSVRTRRVAR